MKKYVIASLVLMLFITSCKENKEANSTQNNDEMAQSTQEVNKVDPGEETLKIANAFMGAMGQGDMETMVNLMHEDMVWHNEGDSSLPWIGPWEGKTAILEEFMPLFGENFKTVQWQTEDGFASGDTAAFFGRMAGLLTKTDTQTKEFTFALRVKIKEGKVILWNWFEDSYEVSKAYHNE